MDRTTLDALVMRSDERLSLAHERFVSLMTEAKAEAASVLGNSELDPSGVTKVWGAVERRARKLAMEVLGAWHGGGAARARLHRVRGSAHGARRARPPFARSRARRRARSAGLMTGFYASMDLERAWVDAGRPRDLR